MGNHSSALSHHSNHNIEHSLLRAMQREIKAEQAALLKVQDKLTKALNLFESEITHIFNDRNVPSTCTFAAPVSAPSVSDSCHPAGSLQTNGDVVTTPGGYRIEMIGQHEWKITGPDGKSTRVWGDPHVDEGDRDGANDWEFKRNSTFILGDGTRINVTTVPWGESGMTVTGQLEIISGNDRVVVSDIDKGKGQIGTVTQDGLDHANSFQGDVFRMGRESDDWAKDGREIIGSEGGGDSFKLGGQLSAPDGSTFRYEDAMQWATALFNSVLDRWQSNWQPNNFGLNPYNGNDTASWEHKKPQAYNRRQHAENLAHSFRELAQTFMTVAVFMRLGAQLSAARQYGQMPV